MVYMSVVNGVKYTTALLSFKLYNLKKKLKKFQITFFKSPPPPEMCVSRIKEQ